jgi:hypothetical protein
MVCPECKQSLGDDPGELSPEAEKRIVRGLKKIIFRDICFFAGALFIIILISLWSIKEGMEKIAVEKIEQRFEEPRMEALLQRVARTKAQDMMERQIDPELKRFHEELSDRLSELEDHGSLMKEKMQRDYQVFSNEVLRFQKRSTIYELGDTAIEYMSRSAYEKLLAFVNDPADPSLQLAAKSEITRINSALLSSTRTVDATLSMESASETASEASDISTPELIELLINDAVWKSRARSAQLLAERKELGVPEALIESMRDEDNLEVLKDSVRAFEAVTGYRPPEILGYEYCSEWWEANSSAFIQEVETSG